MDPTFTAVFRLGFGDASALLWLEPGLPAQAPALAFAFGHRFHHEGPSSEPDLNGFLVELTHRLREQTQAPAPTARAMAALEEAQAAIAPGSTLTLLKRLPLGQRLPDWARFDSLGRGPPPARGPGLWPFDAELAGLDAGLRQLVKREPSSRADLAAHVEWLSGRGLHLRVVDADGRAPVLFAAKDEPTLARAAEAERAANGGGPEGREADTWLGEALGYPTCCARAYAALDGHRDLTLAVAFLPPSGSPPASALNLWLAAPLALTSHAHCTLECAPSAALTDALLDELDRQTPGFRERWMHLARRLHLIDRTGRVFAIDVEGDLEAGTARVGEAAEIVAPEATCATPGLRFAVELTGSAIALRDDWFELDGPEHRTAALAADHRRA